MSHTLIHGTIRSMATTTEAERLGQVLRAEREKRGWSLDEAFFQARLKYPNLRLTRAKMQRLEVGKLERDRLDLGLMIGLCALYELKWSDVDPDGIFEFAAASEELARAANLISPCFHEPPDPHHPTLALTA